MGLQGGDHGARGGAGGGGHPGGRQPGREGRGRRREEEVRRGGAMSENTFDAIFVAYIYGTLLHITYLCSVWVPWDETNNSLVQFMYFAPFPT